MQAYFNGLAVSLITARNVVVNAYQDQGGDRDNIELIFASALHAGGEEQRDMLTEYGIEIVV